MSEILRWNRVLELMHPYTTSVLSEGVFFVQQFERHLHVWIKMAVYRQVYPNVQKDGRMPIKPQTSDT